MKPNESGRGRLGGRVLDHDGQIVLDLRLRESASFNNFFPGPNEEALSHTRALFEQLAGETRRPVGARVSHLWGRAGVGKTHLLHAAVNACSAGGGRAIVASLRDLESAKPGMLVGLASLDLVCIDDLDWVAGLAEWEAAVFTLYNEIDDSGATLLFATRTRLSDAGFVLPDLRSRLAAGVSVQMHEPNDLERRQFLQRVARTRGFTLSDPVCEYLLRWVPRDTHSLIEILDRFDEISLRAKRRITIPFIKRLLEKSKFGPSR